MIVPELLQYDFNHSELTQVLIQLLSPDQQNLTQKILIKLKTLKHNLSEEQADCSLDELVLHLLAREKNA